MIEGRTCMRDPQTGRCNCLYRHKRKIHRQGGGGRSREKECFRTEEGGSVAGDLVGGGGSKRGGGRGVDFSRPALGSRLGRRESNLRLAGWPARALKAGALASFLAVIKRDRIVIGAPRKARKNRKKKLAQFGKRTKQSIREDDHPPKYGREPSNGGGI